MHILDEDGAGVLYQHDSGATHLMSALALALMELMLSRPHSILELANALDDRIEPGHGQILTDVIEQNLMQLREMNLVVNREQ